MPQNHQVSQAAPSPSRGGKLAVRGPSRAALGFASGRGHERALSRARLAVGQPEIHLFLEALHLRDLHLDSVPELDDPPCAAAEELAPVEIELVEIILQARDMDQPAQAQARDIDEEPEVPHVDHQAGVAFEPTGLQLMGQMSEELHLFAVALRVRGASFRFRDVIRGTSTNACR